MVSDAINNKAAGITLLIYFSHNLHQACATFPSLASVIHGPATSGASEIRARHPLFWCWLGAASAIFPPEYGQEDHEHSSSRDPSDTSGMAQLASDADEEQGSGQKQTQPYAEG